MRTFCKDVAPGGGRIFECLRSHKDRIDPNTKCYASLFKLQQNVNQDSALDVYLSTECNMEIKTFCSAKSLQNNLGPIQLLTCLKLNINQEVRLFFISLSVLDPYFRL